MSAPTVIWTPQAGPQTHLITCPVFEVFYGGARGGGKTDGSIGDWLMHSHLYGSRAIGVFFRRQFKQLEEVIARTKLLFDPMRSQGAKYNEQKAEWIMPNGARLKFRYIERDKDAEQYQGHNYTRVYIEEVTNFPTPAPINLLRGTLRSATGVPTGMRLTGNPGGAGHHWVKTRYIDPNPAGYEVLKEEFVYEGVTRIMERVFIPAKLSDNKMLMEGDPLYVARLQQTGSENLVKAWLEGNWNVIDGAFFDNFDVLRHVLPASWSTRIPPGTRRFRAFDWGSAKPFACGWYAISDGTWGLPKDALFKYAEWYGASGVNKGLKMNAADVGRGIIEREHEAKWIVKGGVADPAIYIKNGGPSIAELMLEGRCGWRRADNKRIPGWQQLRARLDGDGERPMIYFSELCDDTIRTLPTLQHDDGDVEDLDTEQEDHAADETRYAVMSRPWYPKTKLPEASRIGDPRTGFKNLHQLLQAKVAAARRNAS